MVRVEDLEVGFTMKPRIANGFVPIRSVFRYGFVAMRSVFGFAMGDRKTQHRERQVVLQGERERIEVKAVILDNYRVEANITKLF